MKLLITGAISWNQEQKKEIQNIGHEIIYIQDERVPLKEQGISLDEIEGTICNSLFLYNDISVFEKLRYIQLTSVGFDRVPMAYIRAHNIEIHNAKDIYSIPMAEFVIGGVLQIYKQSHYFYSNQQKHKWEKHRDLIELAGKKVCIIGCGNVGTECAKRFSAFGCRIAGIDIYPRKDDNFEQMLEVNCLEPVLRESDIVVLTLPLTNETKYIMNKSRFGTMKSGAVLVNIARGAIVETEAFIQALPNLGGAVLDVFEDEPLSADSPLWDMENVIITPHNSFVGEKNRERLQKVIIDSLKREGVKKF